MKPRIALLTVFDDVAHGLRMVGSVLKQKGFYCAYVTFKITPESLPGTQIENEIVDEEFGVGLKMSEAEVDLLVDLLKELKIDVLGLTTTSVYHCHLRHITRAVREKLGIPVVWGGIDAIVNPDICIKEADVVCTGEGEEVMPALAEALQAGSGLDKIDGIWWKDAEGVHQNPPQAPFEDLNALPYADWSLDDYYVVTDGRLLRNQWHPDGIVGGYSSFLMTSRGCPMRCSYCLSGLLDAPGRRVRQRSVDHVLGELREIKRAYPGLEIVFFGDEIFTLNKKWLREFLPRFRKEIGIKFICYTYPGTGDAETFRMLAEGGMTQVILGVQSGSERTNRELYNRPAKREDVIKTAETLRDLGLVYLVELIEGNPLETEDDHRQTLQLLLDLPRPYTLVDSYRLRYFRNYPLTEQAEKSGVKFIHYSPTYSTGDCQDQYLYWSAMFLLAGTNAFSKATIDFLLDNDDLRKNPEPLYEIATAYHNDSFCRGSLVERMRKERRIAYLERQVATLRGSCVVKAYLAGRRLVTGRRDLELKYF